jgi:hypothetical protein
LSNARITTGWGIDEGACAVFEDEVFSHALGRSVYQVKMSDFVKRSYPMDVMKQAPAADP